MKIKKILYFTPITLAILPITTCLYACNNGDNNPESKTSIYKITTEGSDVILYGFNDGLTQEQINSKLSGKSSIDIPDEVTIIADNAFGSVTDGVAVSKLPSNITSITWGGNSKNSNSKLTKIGKEAFAGSKLTKFNFPDYIDIVESRAFYGCSNLIELSIKGEVRNWGNNGEVDIFKGLPKNGTFSCEKFYGDGYLYSWNVVLEEQGKLISDGEWYINDKRTFPTPELFKEITYELFPTECDGFTCDHFSGRVIYTLNGNSKILSIPSKYSVVSYEAFAGTDSSVIPSFMEGIKFETNDSLSIKYNAFKYAPFKKIILPSKVSLIDEGAFAECKNMEELDLSNITNSTITAFTNNPFAANSMTRWPNTGKIKFAADVTEQNKNKIYGYLKTAGLSSGWKE